MISILFRPELVKFRIFKKMKTKTSILPKVLNENLPKIRELCQKHKIKKLWVFGSVLTGNFRDDSDIDFLHEWDEENISDEEYLDNLYDFIDELKSLFNRKIDFVHYPSLKNPYFLKDVDRTKVLLYAQRPEKISL